jgi:hypothetical protein
LQFYSDNKFREKEWKRINTTDGRRIPERFSFFAQEK